MADDNIIQPDDQLGDDVGDQDDYGQDDNGASAAPQSVLAGGSGIPPTPIQPSQVLAQANASIPPILPPPQAPQQQAPPQSLSGTLITAALRGLSGGIAGAVKDMAARGQRPETGEGAQMGIEAAQQGAKDDQAKLDATNQAAQKNYENQVQQHEMATNDLMKRAQIANANISAIAAAHNIYRMDEADQEKYFTAQAAKGAQYSSLGITPIAEVPGDVNSLGAYLKSSGKSLSGIDAVHKQDADGKDVVDIYDLNDPRLKPVGAAGINAQLPGGLTVPSGTTMEPHAAKAYVQNQTDLYHKSQLTAQLNKQTQDAEMKRTQYSENAATARERDEQAHADQRAAGKDSIDPNNPNAIADFGDRMYAGKAALTDLTGMKIGQAKLAIENYMTKAHPDYNTPAYNAYAKQAASIPVINAMGMAKTLFGTNGQPGTLDQIERALKTVPQTGTPFITKLTQGTAYETGSPQMAAIKSLLPEVQTELGTFMSGLNASTDLRLQKAVDALQTANNPEAIQKSFDTIRQAGKERLSGTVGQNPFMKDMYKDINDPQSKSRVGDKVMYQGKPHTVTGVHPDGKLDINPNG